MRSVDPRVKHGASAVHREEWDIAPRWLRCAAPKRQIVAKLGRSVDVMWQLLQRTYACGWQSIEIITIDTIVRCQVSPTKRCVRLSSHTASPNRKCRTRRDPADSWVRVILQLDCVLTQWFTLISGRRVPLPTWRPRRRRSYPAHEMLESLEFRVCKQPRSCHWCVLRERSHAV